MPFDPTHALLETLRQHGVWGEPTPRGIIAPDHEVLFSCEIFPREKPAGMCVVQLDVRAETKALSNGPLIESCAGWAEDEEQAGKHAFSKFLQASLHVLMASLLNRSLGDDQVDWETWKGPQRSWDVCLGPLTFHGTPPDSIECGELLDVIRDDLSHQITPGIHWVRIYFSRMSSPFISEALLDNQEWPELRRIISSWNWPEGEYSARMFFMMLPGR
jgi:Family of unknown function (DUF6348)